jgi:hypothetical protein
VEPVEETSMGRTVPTFTMVLQQEMESWSKFRRGLRREDQDALDDLFRAARLQLAGSAYAARPIPFESIVMAMLVAQQRRIAALEGAQRKPAGLNEAETCVVQSLP